MRGFVDVFLSCNFKVIYVSVGVSTQHRLAIYRIAEAKAETKRKGYGVI